MASVTTNPLSSFYNNLRLADPSLVDVANKLPKQGVQSFEMDPTGRFQLVLDREYGGTPGHTESKWASKMTDASISVAKVVTGKIDCANKSVQFDSKCIVATKKSRFMNLNVSLTEVKAGEDASTIEVVAEWGPFPKRASFSTETMLETSIKWN